MAVEIVVIYQVDGLLNPILLHGVLQGGSASKMARSNKIHHMYVINLDSTTTIVMVSSRACFTWWFVRHFH
jgi:hypothetical protein